MSFAILGLGTAVPDTMVSQEQGKRVARQLCCRTEEQATWLQSIYDNAGVRTRHLVLGWEVVQDFLDGTRHSGSVFLPSGTPEDLGPTTAQRLRQYASDAAPLAFDAARRALRQSGVAPGEITHIVTVSCTGFQAPGVDVELIRRLGLPSGTERTHVGYMGCHGSLNALRVARAFTTADEKARVLVCAVELCSLHYYYNWDPQKVIANALFADGAAALVGGPEAAAPAGAWKVVASGSCLFPDSAGDMTWTVGDHGFVMTLSRRVPGLISAHLRPWLTAWLGQHGLSVGEVGAWAIHPGGPRILDSVEDALGLSRPLGLASREVFAEYGNMSSPTVLFILDRLRGEAHASGRDTPRPCVALGFGPGLTVEAALLH
jgi:predicted naringenin-chalcone synthase